MDFTIRLYDASGKELAAESIQPYAVGKSFSRWCSSNQRKLDILAAAHPKAVSATIATSIFKLANGRSQWCGYNRKAA